MKYPKMNRQARRTVSIPSLAGGINLRDSLNMCNDNQLTDSVNMWFRDGVLKTRDGLTVTEQKEITDNTGDTYGDSYSDIKHHKDIFKYGDDKVYRLVSCKSVYLKRPMEGYPWTASAYNLHFLWCAGDELELLPDITEVNKELENYFVCQYSGALYCYVKNMTYETDENGEYIREYKIHKLTDDVDNWTEITEDDYYAPRVYWHCKVTGSLALDSKSNVIFSKIDFSGTQYEGFNSINSYYRIIYSTVNKDLLTDSITEIPMKYLLPIPLEKSFVNKKIKAKITYSDGTVAEHKAEIMSNGQAYETDFNGVDGLKLCAKSNGIWFEEKYDEEYTVTKYLTESDFIEDNLEITAPCNNDTANLDKIFNMTRSEWFGGASAGINGGTRLFLGGNTAEEEKSLMLWSGLNNPLYFPENCYSYVGNSMSGITGFGKQSDMLVIFKDSELYYTHYAQNTEITAENLINQSVVDYTASSVYFPLVQIHTGIGCDCPDTLQLCRNRLVWADSSGKVYTLMNNNQYSERNIFSVGDMVERRLKSDTYLKNAFSADYDGYYMLFAGNRVYLMDYNSYGYQYISSYSKTEDANLRIPWYYWELPEKGINDYSVYFSAKGGLCRTTITNNQNGMLTVKIYSFTGDTDDGEPIPCFAQTKFFDFGLLNYRKNIESVGLNLGNNGGEPITVKYITESGEDYSNITLTDSETEIRNAGYIQSKILNPCIRQAVRFGVRLYCDGNMAIEGLNITYRTLGGAR